MRKLFLCILFIAEYNAFTPSILNHWNCIGFNKNIDWSKPYKFNVGDIPLVAWQTANGEKIASLNICQHLGSELDKGEIKDGCLMCPYHNLPHTKNDAIGTIAEHDDKIWWSLDPVTELIPTMPFHNNDDFVTSHLQVDMDESLPFCAYNSIDLSHPEFVHSAGFGSSEAPTEFDSFTFNNKKTDYKSVGIFFKYHMKNNIKLLNMELKHNSSKNFNMFTYPSTAWSLVSLGSQKMVVGVSMLPIEKDKTRWFVTVRHNYMKNFLSKELIKHMTYYILNQDEQQFKKQAKQSDLKEAYCFKKTLVYDEPIMKLRDMFKSYKYPNIKDTLLD